MSVKVPIKIALKALKAVLLWPIVCKNWWVGVQSYCGWIPANKKIVYKLRNGLNLEALGHEGDFQIVREVFTHDTYLKFINFSTIKTVVDLGAHKGYVALQLAQKIGKNVRILCVEPETKNFEQLDLNVQKNGFSKQVTMENCAVHTKDGHLTLYTTPYTPGHTAYTELCRKGKKRVEVPCKSLKTLINEYHFNRIDLLKMDIEGAEYEVIFNLEDSILDQIKYIVVECHKIEEYSVSDMVPYLEAKGFTCRFPYEFETLMVCSRV
ncbi:FkbM family methyltransferase [bacterium]|nr:FkbM family methyltransferase [bacterium]